MPITQTENKLLNELVKDCITYRLEEKEALQYIAIGFKQISLSSYKHRKARFGLTISQGLDLSSITKEYSLDKEQTSYSDSIDALRLACKMYKMK